MSSHGHVLIFTNDNLMKERFGIALEIPYISHGMRASFPLFSPENANGPDVLDLGMKLCMQAYY